jgi:serine protease DegQ
MRSLWISTFLALCCLAPPLHADDAKKPDAKSYQVPYRLTTFSHVMVRAKINGKGPFNFIVDTGAPALIVSTAAAKKAGLEPGKNGWTTFDRVEIEGGVVAEKVKGIIEDPFQLEGMNGLGLAGAELHGMMGYTVLARYRTEFDFSSSKMTWTPIDFDPPLPERLGAGGGGAGGLEFIGMFMKMIGSFIGTKANVDMVPRGFLGLEAVMESDKGVIVKSVLPKGPAARAGVKPGDHISEFKGRTVRELEDMHRYLGRLKPGDSTIMLVERDGKEQEITIKVGEGF